MTKRWAMTIVSGPKQSGKTTVADAIAAHLGESETWRLNAADFPDIVALVTELQKNILHRHKIVIEARTPAKLLALSVRRAIKVPLDIRLIQLGFAS